MRMQGNAQRYGLLASSLHWVSAAVVLGILVLGFMAQITASEAAKATFLRLHVPLGTLVLLLTLIRLVWWFYDVRPSSPPGQPRWQALAAYSTHALLYLALVVMGASGIGLLLLSGAGAILFFGSPDPLPDFASFAPFAVHATGAFLLIALLVLHTGAALYHQFYKHDRLFSRMAVRMSQAPLQ